MAKKKRASKKAASFEVASGIASAESQPKQPAGLLEAPTTEDRLEEFADDLGRLLGTAKVKAQGWMNQRTAIAAHLTGLRDTANQLLTQLGVGVPAKRGRKPGRPRKDQHFTAPPDKVAAPKKRTMSPEAREKIAAAQRRRWAKQKRLAAKG
jgi:hypothetical protein